MAQSGRRIHRLPQRLDYTLIPAPLDLSLPLADVKSPLPSIIVTPSSPTCPTDFAIAFLAPPPKPSIRQRFHALIYPLQFPFPTKARTSLIVLLLVFVMACHVLAHQLASRRPRLHFEPLRDLGSGAVPSAFEETSSDTNALGEWFGLGAILGAARTDTKRDEFVITEPMMI